MSYTTLSYDDVRLASREVPKSDALVVEVTVRNTGQREGADAVLCSRASTTPRSRAPVRRLRAFDRAGEYDVMIGGYTAAFRIVEG